MSDAVRASVQFDITDDARIAARGRATTIRNHGVIVTFGSELTLFLSPGAAASLRALLNAQAASQELPSAPIHDIERARAARSRPSTFAPNDGDAA